MSEITLRTKGYTIWDTVVTDQAVVFARKLIDYYNEGGRIYKYATKQARQPEQYMLMKVWHILSGSGICMIDTVRTYKDRLKVCIHLAAESPEYIDSSDSEREPEHESDDEDPSPAPSPA